MEGNKLEISGRVATDPPPATYKPITESDTEETSLQRPKSLTKSQNSPVEMDGADEQMLPIEEKNIAAVSKVDIGDVKFSTNEKQNGDAKLDIGELKSAFVGMGKEELMKYANDPFWVMTRWILFVAFWLLWLAMLAGAIIIIIFAPKCAPPTPRTWWEQGPLTEIDHSIPLEKLQEIKEHNIKAVIVRNPYDSYSTVNESTDMIDFLKRAKDLEMNVIIELNPTTSGRWLQESIQKVEPYNDYYIWAKYQYSKNGSGTPVPPNNWLSPTGGSAWMISEARGEYYYAPDSKPHLNFRNPSVVDEFSAILRQWLDAGAKGVRVVGAPYLLVDEKYEDEAIGSEPGHIHTQYKFYNHARTMNVEGIGSVLMQWKDIVRNHNDNNGPLLLAEDLSSLDAYLVNDTLSIDLPRHSKLFSSPERLTTAAQIYAGLNSAFTVLGDSWPLWQYDNSLTALSSDVLDIVTMLLPGCSLVENDAQVDPQLLQIRDVPSLMFGSCHRELLANETVFAYSRVAAGNPGYLVACNPSDKMVNVDFTVMRNISDEITVQMLSRNYSVPDIEPNLKISANAVNMPPKSAIILTYVPKST